MKPAHGHAPIHTTPHPLKVKQAYNETEKRLPSLACIRTMSLKSVWHVSVQWDWKVVVRKRAYTRTWFGSVGYHFKGWSLKQIHRVQIQWRPRHHLNGINKDRDIHCGKTYWYDCTDGVLSGIVLHPELQETTKLYSIHTKTKEMKRMTEAS